MLSLARRVISVSVNNTPPVSTAHTSTLPSFSITSYVPLSNDSTPTIQKIDWYASLIIKLLSSLIMVMVAVCWSLCIRMTLSSLRNYDDHSYCYISLNDIIINTSDRSECVIIQCIIAIVCESWNCRI